MPHSMGPNSKRAKKEAAFRERKICEREDRAHLPGRRNESASLMEAQLLALMLPL